MAFDMTYLNTNDLSIVRDFLKTALVDDLGLLSAVTFHQSTGEGDPDSISFFDSDNNEIMTLDKTNFVTASVDGQADTVITVNMQYLTIGGIIYQTDNSVVLYTISSYPEIERAIIFTKNNSNKPMVIVSSVTAYYAWSYNDSAAPTGTAVTTIVGREQTEIVPFVSASGVSDVKYTPYAYWCHMTPATVNSGSGTSGRKLVKMVDQDNIEYYSNGYIAVR